MVFKDILVVCVLLLISLASFGQQSDSLLVLARGYVKKDAYQDAFKYYLLALPQYQKNKDSITQSNIYKEVGLLYTHWQIAEKAVEYYQKSYQIGKKTILDKPENQIFWLENLAISHHKIQQYDSALWYYEKLLVIHKQQSGQTNTIPVTLYQIANIYMEVGKYENALASNIEILQYYQQAGDKKNEAVALNNIGFTYKFLKKYEKSIAYFEQSLALQKNLALQNTADYGIALLNLGVLHQNIKQYDKAKNYLLAYKTQTETQNTPIQLAEIYNLLGTVYFLENDFDNALEYNLKAVHLAEKHKELLTLESAYLILSQTHQAQKEDKAALAYYQLYKKINDELLQQELDKDKALLKRKMLSVNLENDLKLRGIEKEIIELDVRNIRLEADKQQQNYEILLKNNQIENATLKQNQTENARREAENAREVQTLLIAKQKAEAGKRKQENQILSQQNELQNLALKQKDLEKLEKQRAVEVLEKKQEIKDKEILAQKAQNETQKAQVRSYYYVSILLLILIGLAALAYWQKQRDNQMLSRQKKQIEVQNNELQKTILKLNDAQATIEEKNADLEQRQEELMTTLDLIEAQKLEISTKNENITASITYALRIQQAILPNVSYIKAHLPELFIIYKPRDIVSGDFYWFAKQDQYSFLVLADCTGHGVPGAFMTLIGNSALNNAITEQGIYEPSAILKKLDEHVFSAIQAKAGDKKIEDGMDLVLLRIGKGEVVFASARRPLLYFQQDGLKEIKGSRMPVGSSGYGEKVFEQTVIPTKKGDMFYLFTDGYTDQFGGNAGTKFRISQLREILTEIHTEAMETQCAILDNSFKEWLGEEKQIDDVALIGVRIS